MTEVNYAKEDICCCGIRCGNVWTGGYWASRLKVHYL